MEGRVLSGSIGANLGARSNASSAKEPQLVTETNRLSSLCAALTQVVNNLDDRLKPVRTGFDSPTPDNKECLKEKRCDIAERIAQSCETIESNIMFLERMLDQLEV